MDVHAQRSARHWWQRPVTLALIIGVGLLLLLLWNLLDVFLLGFAGVLFAVLLQGCAAWLARKTPLPYGAAVAIVVLLLLGLLAADLAYMGPHVASQVDDLFGKLDTAVADIRDRIGNYHWGRLLLERLPGVGEVLSGRGDTLGTVSNIFQTTFGALGSILIIFAGGVYMAVEPNLYTGGIVKLFTPGRRDYVRTVFREIGHTLWWWLIARLIAMALIGILTGVGLWFFDVPLPFTLGTIAGLLTFIPNIGPTLALIPPVLLALQQDPMTAVWVAVYYVALQFVESYFITPVLQRQAVSMPPALLLLAQVAFYLIGGILALALTTPLCATVLTLVRRTYVNDQLHDVHTRKRDVKAAGVPSPDGR